MLSLRFLTLVVLPMLALSACGSNPAAVRQGCYRFDDGTPLFKIVGRRGILLSKESTVKTFEVGSWHEFSRKSVEIRPAFYLPGSPADDRGRGDAMPIPSIPYSTFAFDPKRDAFEVPIAASGEEDVRLGPPC